MRIDIHWNICNLEYADVTIEDDGFSIRLGTTMSIRERHEMAYIFDQAAKELSGVDIDADLDKCQARCKELEAKISNAKIKAAREMANHIRSQVAPPNGIFKIVENYLAEIESEDHGEEE
jgi:hypothetical protein